MTRRLQNQIERAKAKQKAVKAHLQKLEKKERQQRRKHYERVQFLWGQVAANALQEGVLTVSQWKQFCEQYLTNEKEQQDAIAALENVEAIVIRKKAITKAKSAVSMEEETVFSDSKNQPPIDSEKATSEADTMKKG